MLQSHVTLSQCLFRCTPLTLRECLQTYTNIVTSISEHILHGRTGLMGALARFLGGPGVVSPPATDSAGSVHV